MSFISRTVGTEVGRYSVKFLRWNITICPLGVVETGAAMVGKPGFAISNTHGSIPLVCSSQHRSANGEDLSSIFDQWWVVVSEGGWGEEEGVLVENLNLTS